MIRLKNNYTYILEQFLIIVPFFITIYATKQYGEIIYADILFLISLITSFYVLSNTVTAKPFIFLKNKFSEKKIIKIIFSINIIGFLISFIFLLSLSLYLQGIYLYLIFLSLMLFAMSFNFIRFAYLGSYIGKKISLNFILAAIIGALTKIVIAYFVLDQFYFLATYVIENIIWSSFLIYILLKNDILKEHITKEEVFYVLKVAFPFFFITLLDKIFTIITTTFVYILFKAEILIILLLAQRINHAQSLFLNAIDNILVSNKDFKASKKYLLFSFILSIICIVFIYIALLFVINPLLGPKFNDLSSIYLNLAPLALIGSIGFYLTQKKLESSSVISFFIAAIVSFLIGVISLQFVDNIRELIIVFYIQAAFYYVLLISIKR